MSQEAPEPQDTTPVLINRGDFESLLCTMLISASHAGRCRVLHPRTGGPAGERLEERARWQAKLLEVELETPETGSGPGTAIRELTEALSAASEVEHVIWPRRCGPKAADVADSLALARHLATAIALERGSAPLVVQAPIIDLTEPQVLELLLEANAPFSAAWPCEGNHTMPCGV